jgi:hypothetical protein
MLLEPSPTMRTSVPLRLLACALAPVLAGCSDVLGSRDARVPGVIAWVTSESAPSAGLSTVPPHMRERIVAPDSVEAGVFFDATVITIGADGCWRAAGEEVQLDAMVAEVRPYDSTGRTADAACRMALVELPRTVRLRFAAPGEATIRVRGRQVVDGNFAGATEVAVEKRVVVR